MTTQSTSNINLFSMSPIAHGAKYAVVKAVSENRCTSDRVEDLCVDLLVSCSAESAEAQRLTRVIEELISGAMSGAGSYNHTVVYGAVRGSIRGACEIGLDPVSAAIVAVETAATAWTDEGNPLLIEAAVRAAMSAAKQIGPPVQEDLHQWLSERIPLAACCLNLASPGTGSEVELNSENPVIQGD